MNILQDSRLYPFLLFALVGNGSLLLVLLLRISVPTRKQATIQFHLKYHWLRLIFEGAACLMGVCILSRTISDILEGGRISLVGLLLGVGFAGRFWLQAEETAKEISNLRRRQEILRGFKK